MSTTVFDNNMRAYARKDASITRKFSAAFRKLSDPSGKDRLRQMLGFLFGDKKVKAVRCDVLNRKVARNILRAEYGNSGLKDAWKSMRTLHIIKH
jgi:hypothetical protein